MTISGAAVKDWVKVHLAGQKTDRNDALTLAHLSRDTMLKPIRTKTVAEMRMRSIYAARKQLVKCRTSILVSLKGMSQAWGILFSAQRRNLKKMKESLENKLCRRNIFNFYSKLPSYVDLLLGGPKTLKIKI